MKCTTDNCKYPGNVCINNNIYELIVFVFSIQIRIILSDTLDGKLKFAHRSLARSQLFKNYVTSKCCVVHDIT